jgi:Arc/MetJ-type ribon-helix-helix transcriptional regulator
MIPIKPLQVKMDSEFKEKVQKLSNEHFYGNQSFFARKAMEMMMKKLEKDKSGIKDLKEVDTTLPEGKMFMAALAMLTTSTYRDKTPWEVIDLCSALASQMYAQ